MHKGEFKNGKPIEAEFKGTVGKKITRIYEKGRALSSKELDYMDFKDKIKK